MLSLRPITLSLLGGVVMGWRCTPQVIGLVRGEPKAGQKHRANGGQILREMGIERYSKSDTLDRTRSQRNQYSGYRSGGDCWTALEQEANEYRVKGKTKNGKDYERSLRFDAVVGWAVIYNPPAEMTVGWTKEDYQKFYRDSREVMAAIKPELFRVENIKMSAIHRDEGVLGVDGRYSEHVHDVGVAKNAEGKFCGNLIDAKMLVEINKRYPKMMRERGWQLEDLDITDFERMGKNPDGTYRDPEYRASRLSRKAGRSVNKYIADKEKEIDKAYLESIKQVESALQMAQDAQAMLADAEERERIITERITQKGRGLLGLKKSDWQNELIEKEVQLGHKEAQLQREHALAMESVKKREDDLKARESAQKAREGRLDEKAKKLDAEIERRVVEAVKGQKRDFAKKVSELEGLIGKARAARALEALGQPTQSNTVYQDKEDSFSL